jgi:uncharacterized ParB-like nuclease family protein
MFARDFCYHDRRALGFTRVMKEIFCMVDDASYQANYMEGISKFQGARAKAFWTELANLVRGKSAELLSFEDIRTRLRLKAESYRGLQDIELDKIVGSVGRYNDFTRDFLPKTNEMRERWSRVYAQINSMQGVPPIEVYKVGDVYFVRDGNHRVSIAKQNGDKTIQAHVTELPTSVHLDPRMSDEEINAATSYAVFLDETNLAQTRPYHQAINLSEPSRYPELLGHIYLHAQVLERTRNQPVSMSQAAADWYDNVYRPAVTLIRKYNILELTGDKRRTEADVYLWMIDHLREARNQLGEETPTRKFSDALVDYLTQKKIAIPRELLHEEDDSVILSKLQVQRKLAEEHERRQRQADEASSADPPASG